MAIPCTLVRPTYSPAPAATGSATSTAAKLSASDGEAGDQFGRSVAVDGATVVVGAPKNDAAYAFIREDSAWSQAAKFTASDSDGSEEFGSSVAVRGGTIVIGAPFADIDPADDDDEGERSGAAYVFIKSDSGWATSTETAKLILPAGGAVEEADEFGNSVAVDDNSIVVGAPQADDGRGSAYVSDKLKWTPIGASTATTTSHEVTALTNGVEYQFQVRAMDNVGESPPSDIARATPENRPPTFDDGHATERAVNEDAETGEPVGSPVTATDPDEDQLTYSLSVDQELHADYFTIGGSDGQIFVGPGAMLDYESDVKEYSVTVSVRDGQNSGGIPDTEDEDASIPVYISVSNVEEAGSVSLSSVQPQVGRELTASVSDPDSPTGVTDVSWQWERSADGSNGWSDISGASSDRYTPVTNDAGDHLRARVSYTDGHGAGKSTVSNPTDAVRAIEPSPTPTPTPAPTPTPVPITVVPVEDVTPVPTVGPGIPSVHLIDPTTGAMITSSDGSIDLTFPRESRQRTYQVTIDTSLEQCAGGVEPLTDLLLVCATVNIHSAEGVLESDVRLIRAASAAIKLTPERVEELGGLTVLYQVYATGGVAVQKRGETSEAWSPLRFELDTNDDGGATVRIPSIRDFSNFALTIDEAVLAEVRGLLGLGLSPTPVAMSPTVTAPLTPTPTAVADATTAAPDVEVGDTTAPPGLLIAFGLAGLLLAIAGLSAMRERRSNGRL